MQKIDPKGKPFFQDLPMRRKDGKWFVIKNGEWLEYAGSEKDIVWKSGNDKIPFVFKIDKPTLYNALHDLNPVEKVVYIALRLHADATGYCYPSMRTLADGLVLDLHTIQRNLKKLSKKGFIKIGIKKGARGWKKHEYWILKK